MFNLVAIAYAPKYQGKFLVSVNYEAVSDSDEKLGCSLVNEQESLFSQRLFVSGKTACFCNSIENQQSGDCSPEK